MRNINCKLIVSDFDGTLIDKNHRILPAVRTAINEYVESGGIFAVCTGRMLRSILPLVRELGLKGIVVASQGTIIAEIESGKLIKDGGLKFSEAADICEVFAEMELATNVYCGNTLYTNIPKNNKYLKLYESITKIDAEYVDIDLAEFILQKGCKCEKVACLVKPKEQKKLYENIYSRLGTAFDVTCSADCLIEVSPISDNKGEAIKFLAAHYGIPIESTVAVGDNLNDMSMILAAGIGVAVGNAVPELKDAADFISVTNNDGAIAQIINKYGFA